MKCKICGKKLEVDTNEVPAKWYGKYNQGVMIEAVCDVCVKSEQWDV